MRRSRPLVSVTLALGLAWSVSAPAGAVRPGSGSRTADNAATPRRSVVVGAAGDIACEASPNGPGAPDNCQYDETADLLQGTGLTEVLALGDVQYDEGRYRAFQRYYDPTWGAFARNTSPAPGNHDHAFDAESKPRGYFRYFGDRVRGPNGWGYYSFDLPRGCTPGEGVCWHVIALDSMLCFGPGGCAAPSIVTDPGQGNRMHRWLRRDLQAHPSSEYACTLAYWHHPLFSFSSASGAAGAVRPLWDLLYEARADVVLNGHSHNYQRWAPQDPEGHRDRARGIRQFIVGTGGASKYDLQGGSWPANLVRAQSDAFGVLRLRLEAEGYAWRWVTADGQPAFRDRAGATVDCV